METSSIIKPLSGIEPTALTYGVVIVAIFFGISFLYLAVKMHKLEGLFNKMMQGAVGASIEEMMLARVQDIETLKHKVAELTVECERLELASRSHVQQVGIVRFNAFDNTGSDLSFAVAMMDASDTGFVLSGIYGREESRVYAKPLIKGVSTYMLTKEEKQAVDKATQK